MKKNELKTLEIEELKNVSGGVVPGPNGESCTEHGLSDFLKNKNLLDILKIHVLRIGLTPPGKGIQIAHIHLPALKSAALHGTAGDDNGRQIDPGRRQKMGGNILITAGEEHQSVKCVQLGAGLHIHGHDISGRRIVSVAVLPQADGASAVSAELNGHTARLQDPCPHLLGQLLQVHVARRRLTPCVLDPDPRAVDILIIIPNRL